MYNLVIVHTTPSTSKLHLRLTLSALLSSAHLTLFIFSLRMHCAETHDTLVAVSVLAVLMTGAAGVGVRMAEPGEGISGGGSWAELVALACSAAAASLLLRSSASCCSLLSLA